MVRVSLELPSGAAETFNRSAADRFANGVGTLVCSFLNISLDDGIPPPVPVMTYRGCIEGISVVLLNTQVLSNPTDGGGRLHVVHISFYAVYALPAPELRLLVVPAQVVLDALSLLGSEPHLEQHGLIGGRLITASGNIPTLSTAGSTTPVADLADGSGDDAPGTYEWWAIVAIGVAAAALGLSVAWVHSRSRRNAQMGLYLGGVDGVAMGVDPAAYMYSTQGLGPGGDSGSLAGYLDPAYMAMHAQLQAGAAYSSPTSTYYPPTALVDGDSPPGSRDAAAVEHSAMQAAAHYYPQNNAHRLQ